jgi:Protein of unknown function (DUF3616)
MAKAINKAKTGGPRGWNPAKPVAQVVLELTACGDDAAAIANLSAGTRIGDTLFVAADEALSVDRLVRHKDGRWAAHRRISLADLLPLADAQAEVDIEGLAEQDGWLWVLGSHARTRPKPTKYEDDTIDLDELARLKKTPARALIAWLPLAADPDVEGGLLPVARDGDRRAGLVAQDKRGNALAEAMADDPLIGPFTRIPAKEGGIDMEGITIAGNRIALGMRGPVICGHALLLEMEVDCKAKGAIRLDLPPYKRLLDLEGLGIRDLKRHGDDLIILAGPTTPVSGPVVLYRWKNWANEPAENRNRVRLHRPERLLDLPHGRGFDHPEGLALWDHDGAGCILVLYDAPDPARIDGSGARIAADVFVLPG